MLNISKLKRLTANTSKNNCGGLTPGRRRLNGTDAVRDVVEIVTTSGPDVLSEGGLKLQAAPVGKPEHLKVTVPAAGAIVSDKL